jgi:type I restriction enzyme R subunit
MPTPEEFARINIEKQLSACGWVIQDISGLNRYAGFGVAEQAASYVTGLPRTILPVTLPLPFPYEATGVETSFRDNRDPSPRSRRVFAFHRPETLNEWVGMGFARAARLRQAVLRSAFEGRL